jgi:3-phosphoshikimate 1-carboxyvinyltransferase
VSQFRFHGSIPASKSLLNRALIIQSYDSRLHIRGDSQCEDVRHMKGALASLRPGARIFCGEAGTVLRFMALRASRFSGEFFLHGSERLLARPQQDLVELLSQLGIHTQTSVDCLRIEGEGWRKPLAPLKVGRQVSSQFASALLINAWQLPFDLQFEVQPGVSEGYWQMSVDMVQACGMEIQRQGDLWTVPAAQAILCSEIAVEPDYSSAFAIVAAGALAGEVCLSEIKNQSLQPDVQFISFLQDMGCNIRCQDNQLMLDQGDVLRPLVVDLGSCPDLFPVLAVVCAFADGTSRLSGAPHLAFKESDRIAKTAELLSLAGVLVEREQGGLTIHGQGQRLRANSFSFDPDKDHRMAMAAGLLMLKGFQIKLRNPQVVEKSYPEFWQALGVQP